MANLRQLGVAVQAYASDYDDRLPCAKDWCDAAHPEIWGIGSVEYHAVLPMPYLPTAFEPYAGRGSPWRCPADAGEQWDPVANVRVDRASLFDAYQMSYSYATRLALAGAQIAGVALPAQTNVLQDAGGFWHGGAAGDAVSYRYNVLYLDGHVDRVELSRLLAQWTTELN